MFEDLEDDVVLGTHSHTIQAVKWVAGKARDWYEYGIYELDDYTKKLSYEDGLLGYLGNIISIQTFQEKVNEVIV